MASKDPVEQYAQALVYYKVIEDIKEARKESRRFHAKREQGLEESMPCPYKIGYDKLIIDVKDEDKLG